MKISFDLSIMVEQGFATEFAECARMMTWSKATLLLSLAWWTQATLCEGLMWTQPDHQTMILDVRLTHTTQSAALGVSLLFVL